MIRPGGYFFIEDASKETFTTLSGKIIKIFTNHPYDEMYGLDELFLYLEKLGFATVKKKTFKVLGLIERFVYVYVGVKR